MGSCVQGGTDRRSLEQGTHINVLELTAGMFAVQSFLKGQMNVHVHLRMDNTICQQDGGTRSPKLTKVTCQLWDWCPQRRITLSASHLPGVINLEADQESREMRTSAEWMLDRGIFWGHDLFATHPNNQLPDYISWRPDPEAMETDACSVLPVLSVGINLSARKGGRHTLLCLSSVPERQSC